MKKALLTMTFMAATQLSLASNTLNSDLAGANYMFVQAADHGQFSAVPHQAGVYHLTLSQLHPYVTAFSDRPVRSVQVMKVDEFLALWSTGGKTSFKKSAPNADVSLVQVKNGQLKPMTLSVELLDKSYSAKSKQLTYTVRLLNKDKEVPGSLAFDYTALFIDDCCCLNC